VRFDNQLRHATRIIETYPGDQPLHFWLKEFFRANKQMGSRDRKELSALVYSYYRLGHSLRATPAPTALPRAHVTPATSTPALSIPDRLLAGLFICIDKPSELLQHFQPNWNDRINLPIREKIEFFQTQPAGANFRITDIFPWKTELSGNIDHEAFCLSFLRQPDLFIRIRPGHEQVVRTKLAGTGEFIPPATIRLPNGFPIENYFTPDREIVIQDYISQRIGAYLELPNPPEFFWDTCAASGGKSILAHDLYPNLHITASDIRPAILKNLRARFAAAGINRYITFLADLSTQPPPASAAGADLILADVPCTGSGTWGRTPEALYFFDPKKIIQYQDRQRRILSNIAPHVAPDATLVYCTCSVFKKENEEMTEWIRTSFDLPSNRSDTIIGYPQHADTLFAARFRRG
jgi:16S rRNA (cytosine967-C5)-methyltransferase